MLIQFESFIEKLSKVTEDHEVGIDDVNIIMDELSELSVYIRRDLIGDLDSRIGVDQQKLSQQIMDNSEALQEKEQVN